MVYHVSLPADPAEITVLCISTVASHLLILHWCSPLQVLSVQGPSISMAQPYMHAEGTLVEVPVTLSGPNMLPVTANISVSQRILSQGESHHVFSLS